MNTLIKWDYNNSVTEVRKIFGELKLTVIKKSTLTDELVGKLYEARKKLDARGRNQYSNVPNGTIQKSWGEYLEDCGLARTTVHRWLDYYEPEKQRLLTDEEYEKKQKEKKQEEVNRQKRIENKVSFRIRTGAIDDSWTYEHEKEYQKRIKENKDRDERIKKINEKMNNENTERKYFEEKRRSELDELLKQVSEQEKKKREFREQIRLAGDNAEHDFNDILLNYINILDSDSLKIEACHNIIKICKGIVSELQRKSVRN